MFKNESEVLNWIHGFGQKGINRNLKNLEDVLIKFGNPHLSLRTIHVAGTNGKGSTVAFLREILMCANLRVGTFTSPFITCFGERMSIDGEAMSEADLVKYSNLLYMIIADRNDLNFAAFDIITLISFLYFYHLDVDVVIYETGIGGRLDSTNVILPLATAITNVGHDHEEILGNTQLERAMEKLGIVKKGIPLFTTETDEMLITEFEKVCFDKGASLILPLEESSLDNVVIDERGVKFDFGILKNLEIQMRGEHQLKNAILACSIVEYLQKSGVFKIDDKVIYEGLERTHWQGRFELIKANPLVIIDGAHNIEGIVALTNTLQTIYKNKRKKFIIGILNNKDINGMLEPISNIADHVYFTTFSHPNASKGSDLYSIYKKKQNASSDEDYSELITNVVNSLADDEMLIICGSLYFISEVRKEIHNQI